MFQSIRMYVTEQCNASCPTCFNKDNRTAAMMDIKRFEQLCRYFKTNGIDRIKVMGGEPTLHPDFKKIMEISQNCFSNVHLFTNAINDEIVKFHPRADDCIVYNFKFYKGLTKEKMLVDRPGKRGLEVQINMQTNPDAVINAIKMVTDYDKDRIVAIFTLDCTANIFKYRQELSEKYVKIWEACINEGIHLHQDHKIPICFLYKSGIPRMYATQSICDIRCAGLIDASYNLKHCNQYQDNLINMFYGEDILPFSIVENFIKKAHHIKQTAALEKTCAMCPLYDRQCNGGCFIGKPYISKSDILQNTDFSTF